MVSLVRSILVFSRLIPFLIGFLRDYQRFLFFGSPRILSERQQAQRARRITETVARLGPTFIKAVQVLGMREDLIPKVYTEEFKRLQDRVPPFPVVEAMRILREELGVPVEEVFERFDREPIAAASLGQVHKALYRGREVAVKIRRPRIERIVASDLAAVLFLIRVTNLFVDSFVVKNLWTVMHEFRRMVFEEMDFRNEARHADRLRHNLRGFDRVRIPRCVKALTTRRVSVFEFHEGIRVDDVERLRGQGIAPRDLVALLIEVYVHQTVIDGYVHADPHPGNLLIDNEGRLVILDFGMVVSLEPEIREELLRLVVAVVRNDIATIVECFYRLRMVEPGINTAVLRDAARTLMSISLGTRFSPRRIQEICEDIYRTFHQFPIRLPDSLVYLLRASALIEGIGISFDPRFNGVRVATPIVKTLVADRIRKFDIPLWERGVARVQRLGTFWDEVVRLVHRAERDQFHARMHPADLGALERLGQTITRRLLAGMGALALAGIGCAIHIRSGSTVWLLTCGAIGFFILCGGILLPLGKKVFLRDDSRG